MRSAPRRLSAELRGLPVALAASLPGTRITSCRKVRAGPDPVPDGHDFQGGGDMKLKSLRCSALALALLMPSCVYGNFGHPLDTDLNDTTLGSKVGEASTQSVLWLVAWGDSGVAAAAREGGITTIRHMDQRTLYILWGLYFKNTTIVYGD
jgi:hypothetical protein